MYQVSDEFPFILATKNCPEGYRFKNVYELLRFMRLYNNRTFRVEFNLVEE